MTQNSLEIISSEEKLEAQFKGFFEILKTKDIVLLQGPIGAGKTSLVNAFVRFHQPDFLSSSPSYSLVNEYIFSDYKVQHIDLYRVENDEDLESTGFWDVMADRNSVFFIEWPERLNVNELPRSSVYLIRISSENSSDQRHYVIEKL